jgi:hypothetical protein
MIGGRCDQRVITEPLSRTSADAVRPLTCGFTERILCPRGDLNSWWPPCNEWQPRPQTACDLHVRGPPFGNLCQQMTPEVNAV